MRGTLEQGLFENPTPIGSHELAQGAGRVTILEALAQETEAISPDMSRRSTQQGTADFEDD